MVEHPGIDRLYPDNGHSFVANTLSATICPQPLAAERPVLDMHLFPNRFFPEAFPAPQQATLPVIQHPVFHHINSLPEHPRILPYPHLGYALLLPARHPVASGRVRTGGGSQLDYIEPIDQPVCFLPDYPHRHYLLFEPPVLRHRKQGKQRRIELLGRLVVGKYGCNHRGIGGKPGYLDRPYPVGHAGGTGNVHVPHIDSIYYQ